MMNDRRRFFHPIPPSDAARANQEYSDNLVITTTTITMITYITIIYLNFKWP